MIGSGIGPGPDRSGTMGESFEYDVFLSQCRDVCLLNVVAEGDAV